MPERSNETEYQVTRITTYWISAGSQKEAIELAKTGAFEGETEWECEL